MSDISFMMSLTLILCNLLSGIQAQKDHNVPVRVRISRILSGTFLDKHRGSQAPIQFVEA